MPRIHRHRAETIIGRQEELAIRLLDRALMSARPAAPIPENEPTIDIQLDVFEKVGKWVSIKNRLEEAGDTQLDEFKRRIHAAPETDKSRRNKPDGESPARGGDALRRLRQRLPHSANGGDGGDSIDSVGEADPAAGG